VEVRLEYIVVRNDSRVVNWGTTHADVDALDRIWAGKTDVFVTKDTVKTTFKRIDLARVLWLVSNVPVFKLEAAYTFMTGEYGQVQ
jgi:hypothetical protein